ncbi:unnamed protein product [Gongylonema pulchrum]|uniref:Transmembrane protein 186 n=1 Tax=Gongylonema pulchrum TaxID=637853 RepID=A0A183EF43_9BILA|nr:unnamed protein product [Gongylonema pulchrum]
MVLLQGLVFGRILMDSLARRGARPTVATARQLMLQRPRTGRRVAVHRRFKRTATNPFEANELLNRLGGSSIRCLSSKAATASTSSAATSAADALKDEVWIPVYRFRGIHYGVVAAKTKLALALSSIVLIPYKCWQFIHDYISIEHLASVSAFASFATLALIFCSRFFNRLIGVISVNESNEYVRIGYLSFWGSRRNKVLQLEDVVPLSESGAGFNSKIVPLRQYSSYVCLICITAFFQE